MLGKQAKTLSQAQITAVLGYLKTTRYGHRNTVMFLLSLHGLRAGSIAKLELSMITRSDGSISDEIRLEDKASKGCSGRVLPMNPQLQQAIIDYLPHRTKPKSKYLITTQRSDRFSPNAVAVFFKRLFNKLGIEGASSHSGRRTFITECAKKIAKAGGSIRDIQILAGHAHLTTTQRYIEQDVAAQKEVIKLIYPAMSK